MRRKTGRKCSPNDLSGAHGGAQKTKKRGMLQVDEVARRGSWAILAQKFFKKMGSEQNNTIFTQEVLRRVTAGLSTYAPPLNAPPYGRRRGSAQVERPETLSVVKSRRVWGQI